MMITDSSENEKEAGVRESLHGILRDCRLLSMGTVDADGSPWLHNAYFCHDEEFRLYFLSSPDARHSRNLALGDGRVAVTVADTGQAGTPGTRRGVQLRGVCRPAAGPELRQGAELFAAAYPAFAGAVHAATTAAPGGVPAPRALYVFVPERFRLFDEPGFGQERWLDGSFG